MIPDHEGSLVSQVRAVATPTACRRFAVTLLVGLPLAGCVWLLLLRLMSGGWVWPVVAGFAVAAVALGGSGRTIELQGHAVHFADFIAPGLIVMGMLQNAFANASFSLLVGKIQGTIVDYLMPPLSTGEVLAALCGGSVTRAFCVGATVWLAMALWPGVDVTPRHFWAILWFGFLGSLFLSLLGVLTSIWAEKFDHAAAVTNFVVAPLSLLSGTFYSVDKLSPVFQTISHLNPFFYIISGFRYGFLGVADSPILTGSLIILALDAVLGLFCYWLLRKGWNLKN